MHIRRTKTNFVSRFPEEAQTMPVQQQLFSICSFGTHTAQVASFASLAQLLTQKASNKDEGEEDAPCIIEFY